MPHMKTFTERAAEALDQLPEEMREPMVAYIFEQAEKYRMLKEELEKGAVSADAGRIREWNFADFLRRAKLSDIDSKAG